MEKRLEWKGGKMMEKVMDRTPKMYTRPMVVSHQPIRFETAHSWNRGRGYIPSTGNGNGGINYPHPPYTGPHNGNGGGHGKKK
jgi:hypothetical protein